MNFNLRNTVTDRQFKYDRVYVDSNAAKLADNWFNEKKIWNLDFKCKTWGQIGRAVSRMVNKVLVNELDDVKSARYSKTAGCSCGCSPGFIVDTQSRTARFVDITFTDEELSGLKALIAAADDKLKKELETMQVVA